MGMRSDKLRNVSQITCRLCACFSRDVDSELQKWAFLTLWTSQLEKILFHRYDNISIGKFWLLYTLQQNLSCHAFYEKHI